MSDKKIIKKKPIKKIGEEKLKENEEEKRIKLESLEKAGEIAKKVKEYIKPKIKVGSKALDIISDTEEKIKDLGGLCAFPVNIGINNIAAHYTSPLKDDGLIINENDLVKIDLGVHIEGYLVDTAFTINFNEDKTLENIIVATDTALEAAKMMIKPGINTQKIGKKIENIIKGFNYRPIKELGGHQIERWTVHGKKALPELGNQGGDVMEEGDVFAIEIFSSTGIGSVHSSNTCSIFELNPYAGRIPLRRKSSKRILGYVNKNFKTLPFTDRWLSKEFQIGVTFGLQELIQQRKIRSHYVLAEKKGTYIAQLEETIIVTDEGYRQFT
ncbi:MAG: type II methionyl aminopeptidase [Candidatus Lokiarchaeota archaeon]|nr:type II methionyl aminopeptidase [Candidatus Lokiarchaeota archaeon]